MTLVGSRKLYYFAIYILGFILFWEWLRPLEDITDTSDSYFFVLFSAVSFFLYYLNLPIWLSLFLRLSVFLYIVHALFFEGSLFQLSWLLELIYEITSHASSVITFRWWEMTDLLRTTLFLVLLWIITYLIHFWLIQVKSIIVFFILTIIYLTVLDTFTNYDADVAIVRAVISGILILGALQMLQLKEKEKVTVQPLWLFPFVFMIGTAMMLGYALPKADPQWPDPVPFIKSVATGNNSSVNKIGYGIDDSRLGGSFVMDNTPVFTAEVKERHYWRVEAKDYYTGKGWDVSGDYGRQTLDKDSIQLNIIENPSAGKELSTTISIVNRGDYPHIAYPTDLLSLQSEQNIELQAEPFTGKLYTLLNGSPTDLEDFTMTYKRPEFDLNALKFANDGESTYIKGIYTQLPEQLPERIRLLAVDITQEHSTRYDKVKAVENYFATNGFIYETSNVPIPEEEQDYVDQFLFESKLGYCDNFSTSMVVLLRTLDIPARWVKGYTQGDYIRSISSDVHVYEVKNSHAHSWVEVYFPGVGWIPFEPTKGFDNLYSFTENPGLSEQTDAVETFTQDEQPEAEESEEVVDERNKEDGNDGVVSFRQLDIPLKRIIGVVVFLSIFLLLMARTKRRWYPYWILYYYRSINKDYNMSKTFALIMKLLEQSNLPIEKGETLREYGERIDSTLGMVGMKRLMLDYEKALYSNEGKSWSKYDLSEFLQNLVKKITS